MMKIQKEKKPFKREYIPIILAIIILFLLVAALIYLLSHDFKFDEEIYDPNKDQAVQEELLIDNSNSKCSKEELTELYKLAEKITPETEMVKEFVETTMNDETGEPEDIYTWVAEFTLKDFSDKLYAYVTNDYNDSTKEYKADKDILKFRGDSSFDIVTYTVEIKANDYGCKGETIRKFTLKTKIFNNFSNMIKCEEVPDFKYCQKYLDEDLPTFSIFMSELEKYQKTTNKTTTTSKTSDKSNETTSSENKEKNTNNKYIIIAIIVVAVIGVAGVTLILVKKKRSKEV